MKEQKRQSKFVSIAKDEPRGLTMREIMALTDKRRPPRTGAGRRG